MSRAAAQGNASGQWLSLDVLAGQYLLQHREAKSGLRLIAVAGGLHAVPGVDHPDARFPLSVIPAWGN